MNYPGYLENGIPVPRNTDKARLDWYILNHHRIKIWKSGILFVGIRAWQASPRAAIDAGIYFDLHASIP